MTTLQSRPIQQRTSTLAAAACEYGVRVYTKTAAKTIEDVGTDLTEKALGEAIKASNHELVRQGGAWFNASLPSVSCHIDSALCAFAAGNWNQSLFFQDPDLKICEYRHAGGVWQLTDFREDTAMRGSNLAVVHDAAARRVILFFQDNDGYICSRTATAKEWSLTGVTWSPKEQIIKASVGTGIGVTAWNDLSEIRLYYQGTDNCIYEVKGSFGKKWNVPPVAPLLKYYHSIGDITAVSWIGQGGVELRLYLQNERNQIVEWGYNGVTWFGGGFVYQALPGADVIAFVRPVQSKTGFCLSVLWAGEDQMLYQAVYPGDWAQWQKPAQIANIGSVGEHAGSWTDGTQFTDVPLGLEDKRIQRVVIRSGDVIDAVGLVFTDGTKSLVHGGPGGGGFEFALESGEEIVKIEYSADKNYLQRLRFHTSRSNSSPWYGRLGADNTSTWTRDGASALAGFVGCTKRYVNGNIVVSGLAPIWSARHALGVLRLAEDWLREAETIRDNLDSIEGRFNKAVDEADKLRTRLEALRDPATLAMQSSVQLAESIEYLRDLQAAQAKARLAVTTRRSTATAAQVVVCKKESDDVEKNFGALIAALTPLIPDSVKLRRDVAATLNDLDNKKSRLDALEKQMETLRRDREEAQKDDLQEIEDITKNIKEVQDALTKQVEERQKLLKKLEEKQRRINAVDYPFAQDDQRADTTPDKIRDANKLIADYEALIESKEKQIETKRQGLVQIDAKLKTMQAVVNKANTLELTVQNKRPDVDKLLAELIKLQDTVEKHSLLLKEIANASKDVDASTRAEEFAQKFVSVLEKALSSSYIKGLAKSDELALQVVRDIAGSK